ncbi:MAG: hypothetical protein A3G33_02765 [Omnitrophica bacterium RIFCSPLOWO2_12_FULL_44_17]|uniref:Response regulatory domain-containing protein n=1 Tax=Candidatus Danuiimicrobium aquiferis TaxID=1801832 RepID=A0A1G1KYB0_9BACT|nr:MAG: hypothetical protein A3E74_06115 [Omnitrophica bacterium RIFCSPHIGHO2_12_FULL_44_12]OGW97905.1 MAG: hypothetical protein A3G33_02765 [Omnitrophica bacterium RIFCSPLOWO2_12_FULL_44_17]OGX02838.1 MAG: hypothetical protein A3J12_00160 [Omnitrophica bacterium RIFCSPLOWO2_02_FULL_44_11]
MSIKIKASILIVDDNEDLVESLSMQFSYLGFNVTKATSPIRALELTELICPDLLISDIRMPKLDGINLIRKFKAIQPNVKVILMTGYYPEYEKSITEAIQQGLADRVIQKGFRALEIERLVYELLSNSGKKEKTLQADRRKILFVDDEVEVTDFLNSFFSEEYEAAVANSAEDAFETYVRFQPDVVVTDIKMPGQGGIWLVKQIQESKTKCRIIIMTGQDNKSVLQSLKNETGIEEYFSKPFRMSDVENLSQKIKEGFQPPKRRS